MVKQPFSYRKVKQPFFYVKNWNHPMVWGFTVVLFFNPWGVSARKKKSKSIWTAWAPKIINIFQVTRHDFMGKKTTHPLWFGTSFHPLWWRDMSWVRWLGISNFTRERLWGKPSALFFCFFWRQAYYLVVLLFRGVFQDQRSLCCSGDFCGFSGDFRNPTETLGPMLLRVSVEGKCPPRKTTLLVGTDLLVVGEESLTAWKDQHVR